MPRTTLHLALFLPWGREEDGSTPAPGGTCFGGITFGCLAEVIVGGTLPLTPEDHVPKALCIFPPQGAGAG